MVITAVSKVTLITCEVTTLSNITTTITLLITGRASRA
jgi:hypothetical protein